MQSTVLIPPDITLRIRVRQTCTVDSVTDRMGAVPILSVKVAVTINTMMNFDGGGNEDGMYKQALKESDILPWFSMRFSSSSSPVSVVVCSVVITLEYDTTSSVIVTCRSFLTGGGLLCCGTRGLWEPSLWWASRSAARSL